MTTIALSISPARTLIRQCHSSEFSNVHSVRFRLCYSPHLPNFSYFSLVHFVAKQYTMSGLKKSPSATSVKSVTNPTPSSPNGVKVETKKSRIVDKIKKYFAPASPSLSNRVGCQLWPVLNILKFGGNSAMFVTDKGDQIASPSFSSVHVLPSVAIAALIFNFWAGVVWNVLMVKSETALSIPIFIGKSNAILQAVTQMSEILTAWLSCSKMADYINNWSSFETNFNGIFKDIYKWKLNIRRCRDFLLIFYVTLPTLYFIQHQESILAVEMKNGMLSSILTLSLVVISFSEDVKTLLMYRVAQENFREIRNGIAAQHKLTATSISKTPLSPEKVKQWIHLVNSVRNQHRLACEIQAPQQIVSTGLNIILMANHLFLFVHSLAEFVNNKGQVAYLPLVAFAISFSRLVFKSIMAEKVADEEQLIGNELVHMEATGGNIFIKMELKFLYDLIVNKPAVTSFANIFTLSKAFTLKVLGHVLMCLVVLVQFNIFVMVESPVILSY